MYKMKVILITALLVLCAASGVLAQNPAIDNGVSWLQTEKGDRLLFEVNFELCRG